MSVAGASTFRQLRFRMGYAIITRRYAVPGSARVVEDLGLAGSSSDPASRLSCLAWQKHGGDVFCLADTGTCTGSSQYNSRPTRLLRRSFYKGRMFVATTNSRCPL